MHEAEFHAIEDRLRLDVTRLGAEIEALCARWERCQAPRERTLLRVAIQSKRAEINRLNEERVANEMRYVKEKG